MYVYNTWLRKSTTLSLTVVSARFQTPVIMVNEDSGSAVVTVELDNPNEVPFTVVLSTQNDTATGNAHVPTVYSYL